MREAAMTTGCVEPDMRGVLPHSVGRHPVHAGHRLAIRLIAHASFGLSQTLVGVVDHRLELGHGIAVRGSPNIKGLVNSYKSIGVAKLMFGKPPHALMTPTNWPSKSKSPPPESPPLKGSVQTEPRPHPFLNATNTNRCTLT